MDEIDLTAWAAVLATVDQLSRCGRPGIRVGVVGSGTTVRLVRDCLAAGGVQVLVAEPRADITSDELRRLSSALRAGAARPPDLVVAVDGDLALAARLVRRGGWVLAPAPSPAGVPLTALVQRELTLVPTHDIAGSAAGSPLLRDIGGWVRQEEESYD